LTSAKINIKLKVTNESLVDLFKLKTKGAKMAKRRKKAKKKAKKKGKKRRKRR
jgi:hypothetical protein